MNEQDELKEEIKARYGKAALQSQQEERRSCCGAGSVLTDGQLDPITGNLYGEGQTAVLPLSATGRFVSIISSPFRTSKL